MSQQTEAIMENVRVAADLLRSLSNPNRLSIVCALVHCERSVGELEELLEIRQPSLSQQLAELREANLVATRRVAKQVFYRLADDRASQLIAALENIFCDEETRELLRSRHAPSLQIVRKEERSDLGAAQFAKILPRKSSGQ
jgi:DNA-binding transcriptional ArsR family regulator